MNWSPQQQAMLSAMGYTLYRQTGAAGLPSGPADAGEERLFQALQRAAGGRDPSALALPPLAQLRTSAQAKRALWPALRALRRPR
jgi:hypothetical protein